MSIVEALRSRLSTRQRLLKKFAGTAAEAEELARKLRRHAAVCSPPTLKAGLVKLAEAETAQANAMRRLLLAHGAWPELPAEPVHDGSSNWERLSSDLALAVEILRALRSQIPMWDSIDSSFAQCLRGFADEEDRNLQQLRDLTLKCDPQALN